MTREEREIQREIDFTDWWLKEHKMEGAPTYADAIAWADRTMIEKACSILEDMTDGKLGERFISEFKNKLKYGILERH